MKKKYLKKAFRQQCEDNVLMREANLALQQDKEQLKRNSLAVEESTMTANRFAVILSDLDRCQHGRHEGDGCFGCSNGISQGNPWMGNRTRQIGYDISGRAIIVPDRSEKHDPRAWKKGA